MKILIIYTILQIIFFAGALFYYEVVLSFDVPAFALIKNIRYIFYFIAIIITLFTIYHFLLHKNKLFVVIFFLLTTISLMTPYLFMKYKQYANFEKRLTNNKIKLQEIAPHIDAKLKKYEKSIKNTSVYNFDESLATFELMEDVEYYTTHIKLDKTYSKRVKKIIKYAIENRVINPNILNPETNESLYVYYFNKNEPYNYLVKGKILRVLYVLNLFLNNGANKSNTDSKNRTIDDYFYILDAELKK
jgi:5'-deoxynucleotidase YfbR-like HD superfamily hydrolase